MSKIGERRSGGIEGELHVGQLSGERCIGPGARQNGRSVVDADTERFRQAEIPRQGKLHRLVGQHLVVRADNDLIGNPPVVGMLPTGPGNCHLPPRRLKSASALPIDFTAVSLRLWIG